MNILEGPSCNCHSDPFHTPECAYARWWNRRDKIFATIFFGLMLLYAGVTWLSDHKMPS